MPQYLLITTVIMFACIIFNKISSKLGIPALLAFILLGMFFGSDGVVQIPFSNYVFAEKICSIALIFIMFYGGFGTKWSEAKPVATKAVLLSTLGVVLTAGGVGLFCYYILKISLWESMLIGSVISSTDAASVFSILRSKRLNLKYGTASILEVESGSNDPFAYMLTVVVLTIMGGGIAAKDVGYMLFAQIAYGIVIGVVIAYFALWVLKNFRFATSGFDAIFVLAIALSSYAVPSLLGGNGYLSAYIVGIILGNRSIKNKKALVHFFDGVTGLMQMLIFFLLGLLSFPSQLPKVALPALWIALFLTFVARPIAVFLLMKPFRCKWNQQLFISWGGLRGAASIVFAALAKISPVSTSYDVFHITFFIVLFSILIQGSLIPYMAKKLDMIDADEDVLKTFTDYTEDMPVQYIQFTIKKGHPWLGNKIEDILLPPETLLILLIRGTQNIVPKGGTVVEEGDTLILSAKEWVNTEDVKLSELLLRKGHEWVGKAISEISLEQDKLIIMILRSDEIIIPKGQVVLREKDILVMNEVQ